MDSVKVHHGAEFQYARAQLKVTQWSMAIEGAFTVNSQLGHLSIAPAARTERSRVITFWLTEEDCMTAACADMYPSR